MARYLVTHTTTFTIEADDYREAEAVAEELLLVGAEPATEDTKVEVIRGLTVAQ